MKILVTILLIIPFLTRCNNSPLGQGVKEAKAKILSIGVSSVGVNSAGVVFQCSEESIGIVGYGSNYIDKFQTSLYPSKFHHFTLTGLNPETGYLYTAYCGKSTFPIGFIQAFTTLASDTFLATKQRSIWLIGGLGFGGSPVSEVDLFDPSTETWYSAFTNLPTPRAFPTVISSGDNIYVMGGLILSGTTYSTTNLVEAFNIKTNSWTIMNSMPNKLVGAVAGKVNEEIYIVGGSTTTGMTTGTILNTVYKFQPNVGTGGTWSQYTILGGSIPSRIDMAGCGNKGTIYLTGGRFYSSGLEQSSSDGFIPASNSSTSLIEASISQARHGSGSACYEPISTDPYPNDTPALFVVGGSTLTDIHIPASSILTSSVFDYYPTGDTSNAVTASSSIPVALYYPALGISYQKRKIYSFGGASSINNPTTNTYSLGLDSPKTNSWNTTTSMPRARFGHKAVGVNR